MLSYRNPSLASMEKLLGIHVRLGKLYMDRHTHIHSVSLYIYEFVPNSLSFSKQGNCHILLKAPVELNIHQ